MKRRYRYKFYSGTFWTTYVIALVICLVLIGMTMSLMGAEQKKEVKPYVWPPVAITVLGFEGCQPCAMMKPTIKRLRKEKFPIAYWDIRNQPHLPKAYRSRTYPHIALLIDGRIVLQHVGFLSEAGLKRMYFQGVAIRRASKVRGKMK